MAFSWLLLFLGIVAFIVTLLLFWLAFPIAHLIAVSVPNKRSLHVGLIPQAGGMIILCAISVVILSLNFEGTFMVSDFVLLFGSIIATIGWLDDRFNLPIIVRLVGYSSCIFGYLFFTQEIVSGASRLYLLEILAVTFLILCFVNFTNFMDGIDGIVVIGLVHIFFFVCILSILSIVSTESGILGAVAIGALSAFFVFNGPPARIFLGDSGSILMGFMTAILLGNLYKSVGLIPTLIMPLYFIADPVVTIIKRIYRRERFWEAHRKHYYQQALDGGQSNWSILRRIGFCNLILLILAYHALSADLLWSIFFFCVALCCVTALLNSMANNRNV